MEDVGGADGLEGVAYPERQTANWKADWQDQERQTANFAGFGSTDDNKRSSNKTRGSVSNTLHGRANDIITNSNGYQQMPEEDDEQMAGGNERIVNPNYNRPQGMT